MHEAADTAAHEPSEPSEPSEAVDAIAATLAAFPRAPIDRDNLAWYEGLRVGELRIVRCRDCGVWHHPPGPRCPRCWSSDVAAVAVAGEGTVELATVLHVGPAVDGIDYRLGHPLVSVALDGVPGVRVTAPFLGTDADDAGDVPGAVLAGRRVRHTVVTRDGTPTLVFAPIPAVDAATGAGPDAGSPGAGAT